MEDIPELRCDYDINQPDTEAFAGETVLNSSNDGRTTRRSGDEEECRLTSVRKTTLFRVRSTSCMVDITSATLEAKCDPDEINEFEEEANVFDRSDSAAIQVDDDVQPLEKLLNDIKSGKMTSTRENNNSNNNNSSTINNSNSTSDTNHNSSSQNKTNHPLDSYRQLSNFNSFHSPRQGKVKARGKFFWNLPHAIVDCYRHYLMVRIITVWLLWLLSGTLFYARYSGFSWCKAFYMAVNVGYSVGWGYPTEPNLGSVAFSTCYVLMGASAVAAALSYFAKAMIHLERNWYQEAQRREAFELIRFNAHPIRKLYLWWMYHMNDLLPILVWLLWIFIGTVWSVRIVKWTILDGIYFSVSSLSTGGLWAIPKDSTDNDFLFVGVYSSVGIPLMAFAMAKAATFLLPVSRMEEHVKTIRSPVTPDELEMMNKFGLENGDGEVDKAEFIVLCMVRLGAATPELIKLIADRYNELDETKDGKLNYAELLEMRELVVSTSGERQRRLSTFLKENVVALHTPSPTHAKGHAVHPET